MSLRKKNLLEALKKTEPTGAAPARAPAPSQAPSALAPLFEHRASPVRASRSRVPESVWALAAAGFVLAFVLGFVTGRATKDEARAGETPPQTVVPHPRPTNQPRSFQEPPPASTGTVAAQTPGATPAPSAPPRLEDSPLFDPANLYTVVVASYTKSNKDLAWATHQHLVDAKLPVFPPVESRNLVVVLAGAAPTRAELEKIEAAVKALARDGKQKDYPDAYRAQIDTLIPREKKGTSKP